VFLQSGKITEKLKINMEDPGSALQHLMIVFSLHLETTGLWSGGTENRKDGRQSVTKGSLPYVL